MLNDGYLAVNVSWEARTSIRRRGQTVRTRTVNAAITCYIDSPTISRTADSRVASETTCLHTSSSFSHSNVPWTRQRARRIITGSCKTFIFNVHCDVLSASLAVVTFHVRSSTLSCKYAVTSRHFEMTFLSKYTWLLWRIFTSKFGK